MIAELQQFSRIVQGGRHGLSGRQFVQDGYPAYGAGGLNGYLPEPEFDQPGIVLSSIGARCGKCFLPESKQWASLANTQLIFPDPNRADIRFIWYQLNDEESWTRRGAGQPFIRPADVKSRTVYFPPLDEQRRIAAILDKADGIRRKRERALSLADDFIRSLFLEMFGDPVDNAKGLPKQPLGKFGEIVTGNTPPRSEPENFGDAIEWIKSDNVNTGGHFLTRAAEGLSAKGKALGRVVPKGSILVTCIAGSPSSIGRAAIADRAVALNQQINAITPNRDVNLYFLYSQFLIGKSLVLKSSTNSMKGMISKGEFQKIEFLCPEPEEQTRFGAIFEKHIEASNLLREASDCSIDLSHTLTQRAFRGEL